MKKIILGLVSLLTMLSLTGCGKENIKLDLTNMYSNLSLLKGSQMDISAINVDEMKEFEEELEFIYSFDFKEKLGLDVSLIDENEYKVYYNASTEQILAVLKPLEGNKEKVKSQLNIFMNDLEAKLEEIDGYLVYVSSSDNDAVISKVKESKSPLYANIDEVPSEQINDLLNISSNDYEEISMGIPSILVKSNMYIIVKPTEGKEKTVKTAIDNYMTSLENQWKNYLPDQYELVKNRKEGKIGNYLVYIISDDNDLVFDTISNSKVTK